MTPRTHHCNALRTDHVDQTVTLAGWVNNYRDHGGVRFIDLRDREGLTQIVFHPESAEAHALAQKLRHEDVVSVTGKCIRREGGPNPKLATGEVEVDATACEVLGKADTPPFTPEDAGKVGEETRLKYRFIDLRRPRMLDILRTRSKVTKIMRDYFHDEGFIEVETPFLCRSTPEGARDFLVPARLIEGSFYALPQSPQLFKQLLMTAGVERYVQIARCFRDEDPRADRQAEFTQLDLEMSFVDRDDVMTTVEGMVRAIWQGVLGVEVPEIPRMSYAEAMRRFGSDRPDLRFGMELVDVTELATKTDFKVFKGAIDGGGAVQVIRVPGGSKMTRKETDALAEWVKQFGAGGLPITKVINNPVNTLAVKSVADTGLKLESGIAKFLSAIEEDLIKATGAEDGDLLCFGVSSKLSVVQRVLGELRVRLAKDLGLIKPGQWEWVWVVDFPLVEWSEEHQRWDSLHHPFTAPKPDQVELMSTEPGQVESNAYDLVLNGSELGGGSIRIHDTKMQRRVFELLGIGEEEAQAKFGFLLDALRFGTPPHGGVAFGLARIVMHLCDTTNIREVIAFTKTQTGVDIMNMEPAPVDDAQLDELHIRVQTHQQPAKTN